MPPSLTITPSERHPRVFILRLQRPPDNRFDRTFCTELIDALSQLETTQHSDHDPIALVTVGTGKIYSNGLDFAEFNDGFPEFSRNYFQKLLLRWMSTPFVTVAAINGHAFAGGMMFSFAHDYRVMRSDRGFLCMNEVDLKIPMAPAMVSMIRSKVPDPTTLRDCLLQGKRYAAKEAYELRMIDQVVSPTPNTDPEAAVIEAAVDMAEKWRGKASEAYGHLKQETWREAIGFLKSHDMGFVEQTAKSQKLMAKL